MMNTTLTLWNNLKNNFLSFDRDAFVARAWQVQASACFIFHRRKYFSCCFCYGDSIFMSEFLPCGPGGNKKEKHLMENSCNWPAARSGKLVAAREHRGWSHTFPLDFSLPSSSLDPYLSNFPNGMCSPSPFDSQLFLIEWLIKLKLNR